MVSPNSARYSAQEASGEESVNKICGFFDSEVLGIFNVPVNEQLLIELIERFKS